MTKKIHKIELEKEKIYLKKDFLGWKVIYPIKTNGKINWKNLLAGGSWIKLILLGIGILLMLGAIFEYSSAIKIANDCLNKSFQIIP